MIGEDFQWAANAVTVLVGFTVVRMSAGQASPPDHAVRPIRATPMFRSAAR